MEFTTHTNALLALAAAASWGGGDFSGGMGVKAEGGTTISALRVIIVAHAMSLVVLLSILWIRPVPMPTGNLLAWGLVAGLVAAFSVTAFYIALSRGAMGASAAVSGLLAAAIPAIVSSFLEGTPSLVRLCGFLLAAVAIWLIAAGTSPENGPDTNLRGTMALSIGAGIGFGIYFVALRMDNSLGLLVPMALARSASLLSCVLFLCTLRLRRKNKPLSSISKECDPKQRQVWLTPRALIWACGVAVLDTAGNILFVAATRMGRLDTASVLASLYPAGTILLAAWMLHERPTSRQFAGMAVALVAVLMITR